MISRPQPYRLDFHPNGDLSNDERQLGAVVENADYMFEMLFTDLMRVEALADSGVSALTVAVVAAMIAAAIAAIPPVVIPPIPPFGHYSIMTNGYAPAPEVVFCAGDVIEVWIPDAP